MLGLVYLGEPVVLLIVYAVVVLAATRSASPDRRRVLRAATAVGLVLGIVEIANISVETFAGLSGALNLATTAPLILGPFLVWGVAVGWAARATGSPRLGLLTAVWTAMKAFVLANTFDNGFTHLLGALLVGCAVGLVGTLIGTAHDRLHARRS